MKKAQNRLVLFSLIWGITFSFSLIALAADQFVLVKLPHDVRLELPHNWEALTENQRIDLDSTVHSRNKAAGIFDASSDLNFGANYYDSAGKTAAIMNIRYYPDLVVSQTDAKVAGDADVGALDNTIRKSIFKAGQINGFEVLEWSGTKKKELNEKIVFVTEYKRSPLNNNGNFFVLLVRMFNGGNSFTLTVSYREDQKSLLQPICDRIISSLQS